MHIYVINGPNLNLLGIREPSIYGKESLKDIETLCQEVAKPHGAQVTFLQNNCEGQIINYIHDAIVKADAIIINAAAYSHSSIAILDALKAFDKLVIEVHLTNIYKRETFRHDSYISFRADAIISGLGVDGYQLAISYIIKQLKKYQNKP